MMTMATFIDAATWFVLGYFVLLNLSYFGLNLLAITSLMRNSQERVLEELPQAYSGLEPSISVLMPAFNEQATIVASVRSMLQLTYADFEVIVINDGSRDATLGVLREAFALEPFPQAHAARLPTQPIRAVYRSTAHPNLWVIDKENGGKDDSLNAGINIARHPLFCGVDADSVLARDSLQRVVKPFLRDPDMVASGGTVRVANGCVVRDGHLVSVGLPRDGWAMFQVVEYLRAFLFGRLGWSRLNALLVISGAFGLFRTETVVRVGGYKTRSIGEDMELVVRMHRELRAQGVPYRMEFVPEPVCWTEVPEDYRSLRNQRVRWQRGLGESLAAHWGLVFSRRGGAPGWLAFPFMVLFEWLGPLVEVGGYLFMVLAIAYGMISWTAFGAFLLVAIGLGVLFSVSSLLMEEMSFHLYPKYRQLALLALIAVAENFGYRQLNSLWRLKGLWQWARGKQGQWGAMTRKGSWQGP
ncbi:MAG: glycosyltransferase family 2 protein [Proteobacteria bacterium]|nr:glycosyltransferase family 2 protein [Pseudomonadota bacterium]